MMDQCGIGLLGMCFRWMNATYIKVEELVMR